MVCPVATYISQTVSKVQVTEGYTVIIIISVYHFYANSLCEHDHEPDEIAPG